MRILILVRVEDNIHALVSLCKVKKMEAMEQKVGAGIYQKPKQPLQQALSLPKVV